jgi:N-acetylglutamate synthase-like GNAT family acetyltransferase
VSQVQEFRAGGFLISTDRARLDVGVIHKFLTECYWAKGIPKQTVKRSLRNSLCVGAYKAGKQIGFARVVSDFATYAYIGDVFVLEEYRGQGVSKFLMQCIMEHPRLQNLRRWSLVTRDAHSLYAKFGFRPLHSPGRHMEIHNRDVYKDSQQHHLKGNCHEK